MEQWRDIPGYEGLYQISIDAKEGKCRSVGTGRILKNVYSKTSKYLQWGLRKNGKTTVRQIARWIAITFPELIENEYFEGAEIDHKDTDRLNNQPNNLRWVTRKENINNPLTKVHQCQAQQKIPRGKRPDLGKKVAQYTLDGVFVAEYDTGLLAQERTGVNVHNISACRNGRRANAGGYLWK